MLGLWGFSLAGSVAQVYASTESALSALDRTRDFVAGQIKSSLQAAEFSGTPVRGARGQLAACAGVIAAARILDTRGVGPSSARWRASLERLAPASRER